MTETWARETVQQLLAHRRAIHDAEQAMAPTLRRYHLSMVQYLMLTVLSGPGGAPMRMTDLARKMGFTSGGVTKAVDSAVLHGLVRRRDNPDDKRGHMVEMTRHGLTIWEKVEARFLEQASQ